MSVKDLAALSPSHRLAEILRRTGHAVLHGSRMSAPEFFKAVDAVLTTASLADLKTYLRWHLLHSEAPLLAKPFVDENFHFYGQTLTGATELEPRWKRCVEYTDRSGLRARPEICGAGLPARTPRRGAEHGAGNRKDARRGYSIAGLDDARHQAASHGQAPCGVTTKIGYPDKWRDYSSVKIVRGERWVTIVRATEFEVRRQLNKIGRRWTAMSGL
jgi:putative endopeptidase